MSRDTKFFSLSVVKTKLYLITSTSGSGKIYYHPGGNCLKSWCFIMRRMEKVLAAQRKVEREARQAQLVVHKFVSLVNKNPPGTIIKKCIYN